jgi:hypothetical protein
LKLKINATTRRKKTAGIKVESEAQIKKIKKGGELPHLAADCVGNDGASLTYVGVR